MTSDLYDVVSSYYRNIDGGDLGTALSCFSSDAVYRRPGYSALVGRASIEEYYASTRIIQRGSHRISSIVCDMDEVAVRGYFEGVSRDDRPLSVGFADFWRFAGRMVIERNTYFDVAAV
ncbi:nuclear transport factor 2 family protein [Nocardia pseudobrasiliensis]|uniref:Ketosteroid isomerase-like protein n=1 Tax=Nocardia pseudobrasiliensis TaxID=45979 RepID=A0A370I329_9NOCA|nr:nuclear transport factor 2 family protein [Nocardia pseudobrasiliensis]RDI64980.1 ketosteroid isomerase-like protein [Nocardia pseudobrasiliensis]